MERILFLSHNIGYNGGGAERQIVTVACLLKEKGYDVEFLCYCRGNFYENILEEHDIKINWLISSSYIGRMLSIRKFIRKNKYDVVISFQETPNFLNCFAAIGGKKWKVITSERSAKEEFFYSQKGKIFAWFQRYSDSIVCNSENAKRMWIKHYPCYKDKMYVIYNSVYFNKKINSEYIIRKDGKLHITVLASYQYLKNPIGMIKAIISMNNEERSRFVIEWYGNPNIREKCYDESMQLVEKHNLCDIIHLNKQIDNPNEVIVESDFIALFSKVEGLPNAICEGMTLGKPIIMSRVSDYDVLVDATNGFLCDWDKIETIKNAINNACSMTNENIINMGDNSHKKAKILFSKDNISNSWINLMTT